MASNLTEIKNYKNFDWSFMKATETAVYPSCEAFYGPYVSIDEAYSTISTELEDAIPLGLKFGVVSGGIFTEYVFKNGIAKANIVETSANAGSDIELEDVTGNIWD